MKLGNLEDVQAWKAGGPPPPGSYICKIDDAKEGKSSGGYDQLELSWTVASGDYEGAEIRDWLVVVESTRGKVVALLQATGVDIPGGDFELKVADLIGRTAEVVMRQEPSYKDPEKLVTRVAGYKAASEQRVAAGVAAGGSSNGTATPDTDLPF